MLPIPPAVSANTEQHGFFIIQEKSVVILYVPRHIVQKGASQIHGLTAFDAGKPAWGIGDILLMIAVYRAGTRFWNGSDQLSFFRHCGQTAKYRSVTGGDLRAADHFPR